MCFCLLPIEKYSCNIAYKLELDSLNVEVVSNCSSFCFAF